MSAGSSHDAEQLFHHGICHWNGDEGYAVDGIKAVSFFRQAADLGHAKAMFYLGLAYAQGNGVEHNDASSFSWWLGAALRGHVDALYRLTLFTSSSLVTDQECVPMLHRAANAGHSGAQRRLGLAYLNGTGIGKNRFEAGQWLRRASDNGNRDAERELLRMRDISRSRVHWVKDGSRLECWRCRTRFTPFLRRHHCRQCGDIFCDECCPKRDTEFATYFTELIKGGSFRLCDRCCFAPPDLEHPDTNFSTCIPSRYLPKKKAPPASAPAPARAPSPEPPMPVALSQTNPSLTDADLEHAVKTLDPARLVLYLDTSRYWIAYVALVKIEAKKFTPTVMKAFIDFTIKAADTLTGPNHETFLKNLMTFYTAGPPYFTIPRYDEAVKLASRFHSLQNTASYAIAYFFHFNDPHIPLQILSKIEGDVSLYYQGTIFAAQQNFTAAFTFFCRSELEMSRVNRAGFLFWGAGTMRNVAAAKDMFLSLPNSASNFIRGMTNFYLGLISLEEGQPVSEWLRLTEEAAEVNCFAAWSLGWAYLHGKRVAKNTDIAVSLLLKAAQSPFQIRTNALSLRAIELAKCRQGHELILWQFHFPPVPTIDRQSCTQCKLPFSAHQVRFHCACSTVCLPCMGGPTYATGSSVATASTAGVTTDDRLTSSQSSSVDGLIVIKCVGPTMRKSLLFKPGEITFELLESRIRTSFGQRMAISFRDKFGDRIDLTCQADIENVPQVPGARYELEVSALASDGATSQTQQEQDQLLGELKVPRNAISDFDPKVAIAKGAGGTVHKALYCSQEVAIKRIETSSQQKIADFAKEALAWRSLRHTNIVTLFGIVIDGSSDLLLIMELMHSSLYHYMTERELSWLQRLKFSRDVTFALAYLHEKQLLHRDLKSLNVLISKDLTTAKLADFGLTRRVDQNTGVLDTVTLFTGTMNWMAPELFAHESPTTATDIYALGMTFFEIADRSVPFGAKTKAELYRMHQSGKRPERTRPLLPDEPADYELLLRDCTQPVAAHRPTAQHVQSRLSAMIVAMQQAMQPASPQQQPSSSLTDFATYSSVIGGHQPGPLLRMAGNDGFATFSSVMPTADAHYAASSISPTAAIFVGDASSNNVALSNDSAALGTDAFGSVF